MDYINLSGKLDNAKDKIKSGLDSYINGPALDYNVGMYEGSNIDVSRLSVNPDTLVQSFRLDFSFKDIERTTLFATPKMIDEYYTLTKGSGLDRDINIYKPLLAYNTAVEHILHHVYRSGKVDPSNPQSAITTNQSTNPYFVAWSNFSIGFQTLMTKYQYLVDSIEGLDSAVDEYSKGNVYSGGYDSSESNNENKSIQLICWETVDLAFSRCMLNYFKFVKSGKSSILTPNTSLMFGLDIYISDARNVIYKTQTLKEKDAPGIGTGGIFGKAESMIPSNKITETLGIGSKIVDVYYPNYDVYKIRPTGGDDYGAYTSIPNLAIKISLDGCWIDINTSPLLDLGELGQVGDAGKVKIKINYSTIDVSFHNAYENTNKMGKVVRTFYPSSYFNENVDNIKNIINQKSSALAESLLSQPKKIYNTIMNKTTNLISRGVDYVMDNATDLKGSSRNERVNINNRTPVQLSSIMRNVLPNV